MAIEGTLADFRLPEILQTVAQQQRTGILTLQSETTIVAVSFLAGGVVAADSLAHTVEERLADTLVDEGLVDRPTVDDLVHRQERGEGRLIDLLVTEGVLSREGVLDSLRRLNLALLRDLLAWREGEFKFYGGDEVAYEEGIEPISIEGLLLSTLDGEGGEEHGEGAGVDAALAAWPGADEPAAASGGDPWGLGEEVGEPPAPAAAAETERPTARRAPPPAVPAALPAAVAPAAARRPPPRPRPRPAATAARMAVAAAPGERTVPRTLGLLLAAGLVAAAVAAPVRLLVPFPWQGGERRALAEVQRLADRVAVDRAAKTYFLLEGHFPASLDPLIAAGL
ncbi:MAG TPA: DUF4388 domain-containing protein, partial [Thermoanaerobaculia bacterium]